MNKISGTCALLTLLAVSLSPTVSISVHDYAEVPAPVLAAGEGQAREVFRQAGLEAKKSGGRVREVSLSLKKNITACPTENDFFSHCSGGTSPPIVSTACCAMAPAHLAVIWNLPKVS